MKAEVITLENKKVGEIQLDAKIFGLPVRKDILQRVIEWQRSKARSGTHKTKEIGDVSGTTKKPWAQKGTGRARQGSLRSPQFRGGAVIFGPVVRDHGYALNKKFRKLGLKTALSAKVADGKLAIIENAKVAKGAKAKDLAKNFAAFNAKSVLVIDGPKVDENFAKAISNLKKIDVLPSVGANVYDIIRHEVVLVTQDAVKHLEERLK